MIKKLFKYIFWSAIAILFCFIIGKSNIACASSGDVRISEVFYDAEGVDTGLEWIEIYNGSDLPVNLTGYDLYYGHHFIFPDFTLSGKSYVTIHINLIGLNSLTDLYTGTTGSSNMGDTSGSAALFNSSINNSATIVDFVEYGTAGKTWESSAVGAGIWTAGDYVADVAPGHSIERFDVNIDNNKSDDWIDQSSPLYKGQKPLEEEVTVEDNVDVQKIPIADARQKEAGTAVIVIGTVTVPPNQLSDQYFYIQDSSAGIQIYCYKKDFPALTPGDIVQVEGEISDYYSDKRIKINLALNITIIGYQDIPATKETTIDEISDNLVGQIVTFEGTVSETSGSTFYVEGSGEIKVNIKEETGIDKPRMSRGDIVRITGVVSRYKDTFQVLPFEQSGVTILTSGSLPGAGRSRDGPIYKLLFCFALWNIQPKVRLKQKKLLGIWLRS